ncbi:isochorismatase family protein [Vibrio aestuarianus]|uniref:nicotinamidase n=1 Tax=Vibrio aestuarianus TaxID=28171 RepID=A0ABM9FJK2_9VIBR|nr:isochorismatase family protein [Vibrio aestuarianus]MDE1215257.1 isochorismatase family protein [Vibrio aestuarianus]MDE1219422.1 isochorismatase family protein [Vibrio aestuarianus]MDE1229283.1 isochorismatase family protein [Vibrio aestuarianus]MDE1258848.1 isochorismatase family protein [Vibrio aestuarianus]MDE1262340.1 isochorismatase family protein [Vibrio aestuarianus]
MQMQTIKIDRVKTASVDVDPQKSFSELCPNELPVAGALEIVDELKHNHSKASVRLVSRDMHPPGAAWEAESPDKMLQPVGLPEVDIKWNPHCVVGTLGVELLPGLPAVREYDFQLNKGIDPDAHPYGAFYHDQADTLSTGGIEFLRSKAIDTVIVGGLALDFCVKKSVEQLLDAGFRVILNLASTRAVFPENAITVIGELADKGVILVENSDAIQ